MMRWQMRIVRSALALVSVIALSGAVPHAGAKPQEWQRRLLDAAKPTPFGVRVRVVATESVIAAVTRADFVKAIGEPVTVEERFEAMAEHGIDRGPLTFSWKLSWTLQTETHLNTCQFRALSINVDYRADFPVIGGPMAADTAEQTWWAAQLEAHFADRVTTLKVLRDGAKVMYEQMRELTASSCSELTLRANDVGRIGATNTHVRARQSTLRTGTPPAPGR